MKTFWIILPILSLLLVSIYFILYTERKELDEKTRSKSGGQFIQLKHGMTHYELAGDPNRPLVVLVHGFSTPSYIWDPTFKALSENGFQVLRFDLYGRGLSDRPKVAYDLELFVSQLEDLLAALKIERSIHIAGLSMGGPIAAAYVNRHPDRIRNLTLIDPLVTNIFANDNSSRPIRSLGVMVMTYLMVLFILPKSQCGDFYHAEAFPDWEARFRNQMQYKGFRRAILSTIRNLNKWDTLAIYRSLAGSG
jgi:pimeloyl-ACP methyl ester carboxylesterase